MIFAPHKIRRFPVRAKFWRLAIIIAAMVGSFESSVAQESWATMSSGSSNSGGNKNANSNQGSVGNGNLENTGGSGGVDDFDNQSSGSPNNSGASSNDAFGVENENIFGDDSLDSTTPKNGVNEVEGADVAGNESGGNQSTNSQNAPAQQNASNFNFNNNANLNKQNATNNTNAIISNSNTGSNNTTNPANNAINGVSSNVTPVISDSGQAELPATTEGPVTQEPVITAPTIPVANEFAGAPPIPGGKRVMADGEAPIEYIVESGDTLYDICDQLLDEGGYWPKLWSMNPDIKNPHFIYPGMRLAFYPGDMEQPPFLEVVSEDDVVPVDKGPLVEKELIAEEVPIRTDRESAEPDPPPELIDARDLVVPQEILDQFIVVGGGFAGGSYRVMAPGIISSDEKESLGVVLGGRDGRINVAEGQRVMIEVDDSLSTGSTYTVLRQRGVIETRAGERIGYRYEFVAQVRVEALEDDVAVALVTDSRTGVQSDDIVVNYVSMSRTIDSIQPSASTTAVDGEIIGFGEYGQIVGVEGAFAFVAGPGLSTGMHVPVYRGVGFIERKSEENTPRDLAPIGQVRIIETYNGSALGIITQSKSQITIGDTLKR